MVSYTVKQTVVENLNADLDGKQPAGDYTTNASLTESLQSNLLNYTTNRILEIPQDIKLELNNGTLTLKAGSKVYVPNGSGVFDEVVINSDKTASISSFSGFVFYRSDNNILHLEALQPTSGTTSPSGDGTWYDTGANKIKRYENTSFVYDGISFPLCKISSGSIDQVFNGFGYIGSTLFALPGVKVQIPDGKNENGTYKNVEYATESVRTMDVSAWGIGFYGKLIFGDLFMIQPDVRFHTKTDGVLWTFKDNQWYVDVNGTVTKRYIMFVGNVHISSGKVSSLDLYGVDSVANSNASNFSQSGRSYLSGLGMPSSRYIDLTIGASGSTYTAPANGWFSAYCATGSSTSCYLLNNTNKINAAGTVIERLTDGRCYIPANKGDIISFYYNGINTSKGAFLRFIYAQGDQ